MLPTIEISEDDIDYAERLLLPLGKTFDDERRAFIRNLSTIDLQAVPGSGKTTALLAKLLILEKKLPLPDGSGILVLSHTNAAIDEIKDKIQQHCPKLFRYPNFIGTIQSFVNEFLASPYCALTIKKKPLLVENEKYFSYISFNLSYNAKTALQNQNIKFFEFLSESFLNAENKFQHFWNGEEKTIKRIGSHTATYSELYNLKRELLLEGILCFNDCYALAKKYINKYPAVIEIMNQRFKFVFVDEMQDMAIHQYDLIEKIFYVDGQGSSILQRIGDINQSIYSASNEKIDDVWKYREHTLSLMNSLRLSPAIADLVKNFALYPDHCTNIKGLYPCQLKPHLILYGDKEHQDVIPYFTTLVTKYRDEGELNIDPDKSGQVKVIAWNTEWSDENNGGKLRLVDYYPPFKKNESKPKTDYDCLKSYFHFYDKKANSLAPIRNNILNALLKILRFENIQINGEAVYSSYKLLKYLKQDSPTDYDQLNLKLYQCALKTVQGKTTNALYDLQEYIPIFVTYFNKTHTLSTTCMNFIHRDTTKIETPVQDNTKSTNIIEIDNLQIEVTNVHAVKGQTHCATLYVESFFNRGYGNYESERLRNQFLGIQTIPKTLEIQKTSHDKIIRSAKMAYVGFSRATQLLCIAIHKDRFNNHLSNIDCNLWEVHEVTKKERS